MKTYTIDNENNISVFASAEEAAAASATPFDTFTNRQELADLIAAWPPERIVATFNSLPGVAPVKRFKTSNVAATKIWERIRELGEGAQPEADQPEPEAKKPAPATGKGKAATKAKGRTQSAKGAPTKAKASKKATAAKPAPKAKKSAKVREASAAGPREGSKMAQVIALMQRKGGVTITEVMDKMGWQKHTVRGFVAGALKKAGYTVESFKPDGGERTYRLPK
jgi:hypothetical protein